MPAGRHPPTILHRGRPDPPRALRVAYSTKPPLLIAPPIVRDEVKAAVHGTADLLRSLGHTVEARDPDWGMVGNHVVPRLR